METLVVVAIFLGAVGLVALVVGTRAQSRTDERVRLARIERKLDAVLGHLGVVEPAPEFPEVVSHLEQGRKIQAIKVYREATGVGLAEAKVSVEEMARQRGIDFG